MFKPSSPLALLAALLTATPPALAQDASSYAVADADLDVVVVADPFARWNGTRWRVDHQIMLPYPVVLYTENNKELQIVAYDARLVIGCELGEPMRRGMHEVLCVVEDAAISAAPWSIGHNHGADVLAETDERLTGLRFSLYVTADGRVTNIGLVGEPQGGRRVNVQYENLRQILRRAVVGFHLESPDEYVVGEQWYERNSELFSLPSFRRVTLPVPIVRSTASEDGSSSGLSQFQIARPFSGTAGVNNGIGGGNIEGFNIPFADFRAAHPIAEAQAPASFGRSVVAHRMDTYKGRYLVQSKGTGTVDIGNERPMTFRGELDAVSIYDPMDALMTERVWTVNMWPTASSILADGPAGWPYRHLGNLKMLGPDETSELGPSVLVAPPETNRGNLPPWPSL